MTDRKKRFIPILVLILGVAPASLLGTGCPDVPAECSEAELGKAKAAETASANEFARAAVKAATEQAAEASAAVAAEMKRYRIMRSYDNAKKLCAAANALSATALAEVEAAKKRKVEVEAIMASTNPSLDDTGLALLTGRALLDAVPQPELDAKMREIQTTHRQTNTEIDAAFAHIKGAGWVGDLATLTRHKDALAKSAADAKAAVLEIRRAATNACKPTTSDKAKAPLFIGEGRARSHDNFALVEAGPSEDKASGYVAALQRRGDGGACKTLRAWKGDEPGALSTLPTSTLRTWSVGPAEMRSAVLFAWQTPRAWFIADTGAGLWTFDAANVAGFAQGACASVTCSEPKLVSEKIDVSCVCNGPTDPNQLDLTREVRFSWDGNGVIAER